MIDTAIYNEHINSEDLNTLLDKSSHVMINGCRVDSGGYVSNINSKVGVLNTAFVDTNLVLRDSEQNKLEYNYHEKCGVRLVSVVSGYAYTHQVVCHRSFGIDCQ